MEDELDDLDQYMLYIRAGSKGASLDDSEAVALAEHVASVDLSRRSALYARLALHTYYCSKPGMRNFAITQALSIVDNHPELSPLVFVIVAGQHTEIEISQLRAACFASLERHPDKKQVYLLAASAVKDVDLAKAIYLIRRALQLSPDDLFSRSQLAMALLEFASENNASSQAAAREALDLFDSIYAQNRDGSPRVYDLENIALAAYRAGEYERSRASALEILSLGGLSTEAGRAENSLFWAHTVLGKLAILEGNIDQAAEHMLASGRVNEPGAGVPHPDQELLSLLLAEHRESEVKQHLLDWMKYWPDAKPQVLTWMAQIDRGVVPEFSKLC